MNRRPLDDKTVLAEVQLLAHVPSEFPEPAASYARQILAATRTSKIASTGLAIWPDGTWAMLAHNPEWPRPRPEQLIRAYRAAHHAGSCLPGTQVSGRSTMLGGG